MELTIEDIFLYAGLAWAARRWVVPHPWMFYIVTVQIGVGLYTWFKLGVCVVGGGSPKGRKGKYPKHVRTLQRRLSVYDQLKPVSSFNPFVNDSWKIDEFDRIRISINAATILPIRILGTFISLLLGAIFAVLAVRGLPPNPKFKSMKDLYDYMKERGEILEEQGKDGTVDLKKKAFEYIIERVNSKKHKAEDIMKLGEKEFLNLASKNLRHICWYRPLESWRRQLLIPVRFCARALLFFSGFLWIKTEGELGSAEEAPILISNHVCMIDPAFMVYAALPAPIAAAEHLKMPLLGSIVSAIQCVTFDRFSPSSRKEVRNELIARAAPGAGWPQILIYPEATCTNGEAIITFKTGAFNPGRPVQMVCVRYRGRFNPAWVGAGPGLWHIVFRLMCEPMNFMKVDYGPIYDPNPEEKKDALLYARRVRDKMAYFFDLKATGHSFDDVKLQALATKTNSPAEKAVIEAEAIRKHFSMKLDSIKKYYEAFLKLDKDKDGLLSRSDFLFGMGAGTPEESPQWSNVFDLLDNDGDGYIDFRVYLIGMAFANTDLNNEKVLKQVHQIFDLDGDGFLNLQEFTDILHKACPSDELYTPASIVEIFQDVDENNDGKIAVEEFIKYAESNPKLKKSFALWRKNFDVSGILEDPTTEKKA